MEDRREINIGGEFGFSYNQNVKEIVRTALEDFFQRINLYGYYDVYINGEQISTMSKRIRLDDYDEEINEISVHLDTNENIYESDEKDYDEYLEESFADLGVYKAGRE